jgi:protein-L-isoaspartate(D-aspartate) O-methyltransferase
MKIHWSREAVSKPLQRGGQSQFDPKTAQNLGQSPTVVKLLQVIVLAVFTTLGSENACSQTLREWRRLAGEMVDQEIVAAGVKNDRVIRALRDTPRHEFVPANQRKFAYLDMALPIGSGQTISPPFIVASMTEAVDPQPTDRVLEIGTGSGYQAAVLSPLVKDVYSIEIVEPLGRRAARALDRLGYQNVHTRVGDGYLGWPDAAPFDKILVTCSPEKVPQPLVEQLREGGLMVIPIGERYQQTLYLMRKTGGELQSEALRATLFVPMTGQAEARRKVKPDPLNPQIENGSFEDTLGDELGNKEPAGWHYQRQLAIKAHAQSAPDGAHFALFKNAEPGRGCHALQGFAVDGRKVSTLKLTLWVRGENILPAASLSQSPSAVVTFYDERRAAVGEESLAPFLGTFDWQERSGAVRVPLRAREAILRIGLLGATGELSLDKIQVQAQK